MLREREIYLKFFLLFTLFLVNTHNSRDDARKTAIVEMLEQFYQIYLFQYSPEHQPKLETMACVILST